MRTKFKLLALASAALMLGACADEIVPTPEQVRNNAQDNNAITFSTYMGKTTRAGYQGSIGDTELKAIDKANGFGVFAYYTGTQTYNATQYQWDSDAGALEQTLAPNFMYNQHVYWKTQSGNTYITNEQGVGNTGSGFWTYEPIKYWPNEISPAATDEVANRVDDQDDDQAANPATSETTNGGYVSFFAYAPYVPVTVTTGIPTAGSTTEGIVAITDNNDMGDPKITYVVSSNGDKVVDLLWGTYYGTKENAISEGGNAGVASDKNAVPELITDYTPTASNYSYPHSILWHDGAGTTANYRLNADLTKQKTTGTIGFLFKHALAKVGGSQTNSTGNISNKFGFLAVLDLDDMKGAETGGFYTDNGLQNGSGTNTPVAQPTKVTINKITLEAMTKVPVYANDNKTITSWKYIKQNQGVFNLATGQWEILKENNLLENDGSSTTSDTSDDAAKTTHVILPETTDDTATNPSKLADDLAEVMTVSGGTATHKGWDDQPVGVLTTPKNVYKNEANPLVFIPGTTAELYVTCDYYVRTKDTNLEKGYSEVRQIIKKKINFTQILELNKQYSLLMHIGLTGIKFTASVSNWELDNDNPNVDTDGNGTLDLEVQDVYVPMNVSELMSATTTVTTTDLGSQGVEVQLDNISLDYSDNTDDITIAKEKFAEKGLTFSSSNTSVATVDATTGKVTVSANENLYARECDIIVTRGHQTATIHFTQKAPTVNAITLTIPEGPNVSASGANVTPTVKVTSIEHTNNTTATADINVTTSATYEVGSTAKGLTEEGKLEIPSGTATETIAVKATYSGKENTVTLTYTEP